MGAIYGFLITLIIIFACLNFYILIIDEKMRKVNFYLIPAFYIGYIYLTTGIMVEPFRMITSFLVISVLVTLFEKKINWIALVVAFLMTYLLDLFAMLLAVITAVVLRLENEYIAQIIALTWAMVIFTGVMLLDKYQKITLSKYIIHTASPLVRKIVFIIGMLIIMLYSFLVLSPRLDVSFDFMTSIFIWGISIVLVLLIIFLTIFIVRYMNDERKKQLLLEKENDRLSKEHLIIENQLSDLKQVQLNLQKDLGDIASNYHNYKYVVPVLVNIQQKMIEKINQFAEYSHDEKVELIKDYTNQIEVLSLEINGEFIADYIKSEITSLNIPNDWLGLSALLEMLMKNAQNKGIYLSVYNHTNLWNTLNIPDVVFIRLFSNIVDNAIKESYKLPESERGEIQIIFKEDEGYFVFEVRDGAEEFKLPILKNLGKRKNSTNDTGDGYAEIMSDLKNIKASFVIKEWNKNNKFGKTISIIFDGYGMRLIDSHYRYELLISELEKSEFEVMDIH